MLVGQEISLEFRYVDETPAPDDYYIQIDDVIVGDETVVEHVHWGIIKALYRQTDGRR